MKTKKDKNNETVIDGYDYLGNSCSAMDCTGLIPSAPATDCTGLIPSEPLTEAERDSYEEVYHYQPKPAPKH